MKKGCDRSPRCSRSDYVCGDEDSERLYRWYEGPLGFVACSGEPPTTVPGESEWRSCRKRLRSVEAPPAPPVMSDLFSCCD